MKKLFSSITKKTGKTTDTQKEKDVNQAAGREDIAQQGAATDLPPRPPRTTSRPDYQTSLRKPSNLSSQTNHCIVEDGSTSTPANRPGSPGSSMQAGLPKSSSKLNSSNVRGNMGLTTRSSDAHQPREGAEDSAPQCTICRERGRVGWQALPCGHAFHATCLKPWLDRNSTCPICRTSTDPNSKSNAHALTRTSQNSHQLTGRGRNSNALIDQSLANMADPNMLARFAMPTSVSNFVDRLPTPERLGAEGVFVLVDPVSRLFDEATAEVGEGIAYIISGAGRGRADASHTLAIEAGPEHKSRMLALENGMV